MEKFSGLRIGFDAKRAFSNQTGLGSYSRNTLSALQNSFPENLYILYATQSQIKKGLFDPGGFELITPKSAKGKILSSFWRNFQLSGQLEKQGIDLFHGLSHELPAGIHKTPVPSVVTIHDLIFLHFPGFYKPADRLLYRIKVKYACRAARKIIAISRQTREDLINMLQVPEEKIELVHQPVSQRFFENQDDLKISEVRKKYNLPENFILSVGTLEPRKNQLNILRALVENRIKEPVVFVGKVTRYADELNTFIHINRITNQVKFISGVADTDLPVIYNQADVMVYISKYEGFGIPVIEAMAAGCPVLASDTSCLPETAGNAALLCNPDNIEAIGNGIKEILESNDLRNELISKGNERAQFFTPEQSANNLVAVYRKVITDGKRH